jgi:hypothetical protein
MIKNDNMISIYHGNEMGKLKTKEEEEKGNPLLSFMPQTKYDMTGIDLKEQLLQALPSGKRKIRPKQIHEENELTTSGSQLIWFSLSFFFIMFSMEVVLKKYFQGDISPIILCLGS